MEREGTVVDVANAGSPDQLAEGLHNLASAINRAENARETRPKISATIELVEDRGPDGKGPVTYTLPEKFHNRSLHMSTEFIQFCDELNWLPNRITEIRHAISDWVSRLSNH